MRLARIALILSVILLGTPALQAQRAHSECCDGCSSQSCQQGCGCQACGDSCGLMSSLTAKLSHALGGILPGGAGCDGRHKIYKAALQRNSFDKKFQLPVAYYAHLLPIYKHNRCCCGSTPMANCPTCGPHAPMGEEVIEMHEVPQPVLGQPTPAVKTQDRIVPGAVVPPMEARGRAWRERSVSRTQNTTEKRAARDRVAQQRPSVSSSSTLRSFTPMVLRADEPTDSHVRQVSAVQARIESDRVNPLR